MKILRYYGENDVKDWKTLIKNIIIFDNIKCNYL